MTYYKDDSYALHTDLYQINMAYTYWKDGIHNRRSVFDLYFRKLPFENGYAVFAGLEKLQSTQKTSALPKAISLIQQNYNLKKNFFIIYKI